MTNPLWDQLFARHAGSTETFLLLPDGGRVSYADFLGLAARYAHLLTEHGMKPRDRLAVQVRKFPEALALYAACARPELSSCRSIRLTPHRRWSTSSETPAPRC